jgi:hypothetical protein
MREPAFNCVEVQRQKDAHREWQGVPPTAVATGRVRSHTGILSRRNRNGRKGTPLDRFLGLSGNDPVVHPDRRLLHPRDEGAC